MKYRLVSGISTREVEEELVILDLEKGEFLVSRGIGPPVIDRLLGGRTIEEVAAEVAERYSIERERVHRDVEAFVGVLVDKGLLEPDDAG